MMPNQVNSWQIQPTKFSSMLYIQINPNYKFKLIHVIMHEARTFDDVNSYLQALNNRMTEYQKGLSAIQADYRQKQKYYEQEMVKIKQSHSIKITKMKEEQNVYKTETDRQINKLKTDKDNLLQRVDQLENKPSSSSSNKSINQEKWWFIISAAIYFLIFVFLVITETLAYEKYLPIQKKNITNIVAACLNIMSFVNHLVFTTY